MIQGNPFETKLLVEYRTRTVRHGVERQQLPRTAQGNGKVQGWWLSVASALGIPSSSPQSLQRVRYGLWLPAALVIGILFNLIVGR